MSQSLYLRSALLNSAINARTSSFRSSMHASANPAFQGMSQWHKVPTAPRSAGVAPGPGGSMGMRSAGLAVSTSSANSSGSASRSAGFGGARSGGMSAGGGSHSGGGHR
jgi:hypothetical protein